MSELGPLLHDVIEGSLAPLDVDAIVSRRRRRRRTRRVTASLVTLVTVAALAAGSTALVHSDPHHPVAAVHVAPRDPAAITRSALDETLLMAGGGGSGALGEALRSLTVVDPVAGTRHETPLPLPAAQNSLYPYVVRGSSFVVVLNGQTGPDAPAIGQAYAVPSTLRTHVSLGAASWAFAAVAADHVWLATDNATPGQRLNGKQYGDTRTVREVDLDGHAVTPTYALPDRRTPLAEVAGGLVTSRPGATQSSPPVIELWDPASNRVARRVADGNVLAAGGNVVVWAPYDCPSACALHVTDTTDGADRTLAPPAGTDWETDTPNALFLAPDARHLALIARRPPAPGADRSAPPDQKAPTVIATFDTRTGARTERTVDTQEFRATTLGWSPDASLLFFAPDRNEVDYFVAADASAPLHSVPLAGADQFFAVGRPKPPGGTSTATPTGAPRYQIDARVEQDRTHGPELCILAVADVVTRNSSNCAGPAITNWDWNTAPDSQRANGTTSGVYHLVGTYNGKAFTLTQPPVVGHEPSTTLEDEPAPCPAPPGGWQSTNPARHGLAEFEELQSAAQGAPDFAGMWSSSTVGSGPSDDFQHNHVTVVAYTGNLTGHRAELAALWGGPLCVVQHAHTYAELQATITRINNDPTQLGLQIQSVGPDEVRNAVRLVAIAATDAVQRAIDRQFGPGLVKVVSLMQPIP